MSNHTFPHHTDSDDLRAIARHADGIIRSASISDGTGRLRPATRDELARVVRVGNAALDELAARGEDRPSHTGWLR